MNILHLHEQTEIKGGAEVYISQLQELLPAYGYSSFWIGISKSPHGFTISQFGNDLIRHTGSITEVIFILKSFISANNIGLVNLHNIYEIPIIKYCLDTLPVIKFCHSPVMVCPGKQKFWRYSERPCTRPHGLHCLKHIYTEGCSDRHPKRIYKAWRYVEYELKQASKQYRRVVVMSDYIRNGLLEFGIDDNRILCNPYFTSQAETSHAPRTGAIRRLLFVGRLSSSKGPHILLKMFAILAQNNPDFCLDYLGDGPMRKELELETQRLGLKDKVVFKGWQDHAQVEKAIKECYLLIFPSVYPEAFGITGIEAMMHGKPVVGFDVGGVSTWLKDGTTGFLVKRGDIETMASKIELLKDEQLYAAFSLNAHRQAVERYLPEIHIRKLVSLYEKCIPVMRPADVSNYDL